MCFFLFIYIWTHTFKVETSQRVNSHWIKFFLDFLNDFLVKQKIVKLNSIYKWYPRKWNRAKLNAENVTVYPYPIAQKNKEIWNVNHKLKWLTFLLASLTGTLTILLLWIYLFLLTILRILPKKPLNEWKAQHDIETEKKT